jgi:hypothetical protein
MMRLLRRWHILRGQLTSGMMIGALASGEASASHISLEQEECKITIFLRTPENRDKENCFAIYMSLRVSGLARLTSYGQHSSDTTCHTPFRESGNEASIRVPRMFKSHVQ